MNKSYRVMWVDSSGSHYVDCNSPDWAAILAKKHKGTIYKKVEVNYNDRKEQAQAGN